MFRLSAVAVLVSCAWLVACSSSAAVDSARPVATPSLMLKQSAGASGSPLDFTIRFAIAADAPAFAEDYMVFVHFLSEDGRMIGAVDHWPPTPTRAWKPGSTIEYSQSVFAPTSTYVGTATVVVGLYSKTTGERLPLGGEAPEPRAIKVGVFEIRERNDPYTVVFREGWHAPEAPKGAGIEWRWSSKTATLSFPNPKRNAELVLELDQPHKVFEVAQHVEVRLGDAVVDGFDLEPGAAQLRRIALTPDELGEREDVHLTVVSDKTFVPAKLAELQNTDTRQLGIRVFRAYLEPKQ